MTSNLAMTILGGIPLPVLSLAAFAAIVGGLVTALIQGTLGGIAFFFGHLDAIVHRHVRKQELAVDDQPVARRALGRPAVGDGEGTAAAEARGVDVRGVAELHDDPRPPHQLRGACPEQRVKVVRTLRIDGRLSII